MTNGQAYDDVFYQKVDSIDFVPESAIESEIWAPSRVPRRATQELLQKVEASLLVDFSMDLSEGIFLSLASSLDRRKVGGASAYSIR